MSVSWEGKFAKCPYYRKSEGKRIVCEGIVNRTTTQISFESPSDKKKYFQNLCCSVKGCEVCPIHKLLEAEYDE